MKGYRNSNIKKIWVLGFAILTILCLLVSLLNIESVRAETSTPESSLEQISKQMTDSDQLDGETTKIDDYIDRIKNGYYSAIIGDDNPYVRIYEHSRHIAKIIPIELLKSETTYKYAGKEYLFYVKTFFTSANERTTSMLIIDYDFEYEDEERAASIVLKMCQSDYVAFEENGQFIVMPQNTRYNEFSIYNPMLVGNVKNIHALNNFDAGYSKATDPGVIFRQTRLNYAGAYQEVNYSYEPIVQFVAKKILGKAVDMIGVKDYYDAVNDIIDFFGAVTSGIEVTDITVHANNENNITDMYTKAAQIADSNFDDLSKSIQVYPQNNTMINDYIELKVLLSEDIEPAELVLGAEFNIYVEDHLQAESPLPTEDDEKEYVAFSKEFGEKVYDYEKNQKIYILAGDKQVIKAMSPLTGYYDFSQNEYNVRIFEYYDTSNLVGILSSEVFPVNNKYKLDNGVPYYIELYNNKNNVIKDFFELNLTATPLTQGKNNVSIGAFQSVVYKIDGGKDGVAIDVGNTNIITTVYDANYNPIGLNQTSTCTSFIKGGGLYYIVFTNNSSSNIAQNINLSYAETVNYAQNVSMSSQGVRYYKFTPQVTANYQILKSNTNVLSTFVDATKTNDYYRLEKDTTYYLKLESNVSAYTDFSIKFKFSDINVGNNNVGRFNDVSVLRLNAKQGLNYRINSNSIIGAIYVNDNVISINSNSFSIALPKGETYFIVKSVNNYIDLNITFDYDTLQLNESKNITKGGLDYALLKFNLSENAYYRISGNNPIAIFNSAFDDIVYQEQVCLAAGTYYIKVLFTNSISDVISLKKATIKINPHQSYIISEKTFYHIVLEPNTNYIFQTYGSGNLSISTSIQIQKPNGNVLQSSQFVKFGQIKYNSSDYAYFNIIVNTNSTSAFGFRVLFADNVDIPNNKVTLNGNSEAEISCDSYIELNLSQNVYLFVRRPNISSTITLSILDNYSNYITMTPVLNTNDYHKFALSSTVKAIYVTGDYKDVFVVSVLPQNLQPSIVVRDAKNNAVSKLLKGNTYKFSLTNGGNHLNMSEIKFYLDGYIANSEAYSFMNKEIGSRISIHAYLYDYVIAELNFVLKDLYSLNGEFDYVDSSIGKSGLHLAFQANYADRGNDGTISINNATVEIKKGTVLLGTFQLLAYHTINIDLSNYQWETSIDAAITLTFNGCSYKIESKFNFTNSKTSFGSVGKIDESVSQVYLHGSNVVEINKRIDIPANIKMLNLEGITDKTYNKLSFMINERTEPLLINIKNLNFNSYVSGLQALPCIGANNPISTYFVIKLFGNNEFIGAQATVNSAVLDFYMQTLYMVQDSSAGLKIKGADGLDGNENQYGRRGGHGIWATVLDVKLSNLEVRGGKGGKGGNGTVGANAPNYTYMGYPGGMGRDGGDGGIAILCDNIVITASKLTAYGGNGGLGGQGGAGGNGAIGFSSTQIKGTGDEGSKGGPGGVGGVGGDGAYAIEVTNKVTNNNSNITLYGGNAGGAGKGGTGGDGGQGGKGGPGQNAGFFIWSTVGGAGGTGGQGGDGGNGGSYGLAGGGCNVSVSNATINSGTKALVNSAGVGGAGGKGGEGGTGGKMADGSYQPNGATGSQGKTGKPGRES